MEQLNNQQQNQDQIKPKKNGVGRPTKREKKNGKISEAMRGGNDDKVLRLKTAATIGCPAVEQYHYAGISKTTYYRWLQENPELRDKLDTLEEAALRIKARRNMAERIDAKDIGVSMEYLRRTDDKMRTTKMEHVGEITTNNNYTFNTPEMNALREKYEREMYEMTYRAVDAPKPPELPVIEQKDEQLLSETTQKSAETMQNPRASSTNPL